MNSLFLSLLLPFFAWTNDAEQYVQQQYTQQVQNTPPGEPLPPPPLSPDAAATSGPSAKTTAQQEAAYWIALIDGEQYGPSWLAAGNLLRDIISQNQWVSAMQAIRKKMGNLRNRKNASQKEVRMLPNGTTGDFMVFTYQTNFTNASSVTETIVLQPEGTLNQWKVISYKLGY